MTVFVKSAAFNLEKRNRIRQSWGSVYQVNGATISTLFVVGKSNNDKFNNLVRIEHQKYGDILQYDGADDYK